MDLFVICTIFIACTNVFKKRNVCKLGRELVSFFPPHFDHPKVKVPQRLELSVETSG